MTGTGSYLPSQALTPQSLNVFDTATNRLDGMNGMNTVTVAYDGAGNLTRDWGGRSFTYDGENRMVSFDTTGTDQDTTYYYDGEGRRVKKAVGGTGGPETIYVYNVAGQLVAEYATRWRPLSGTQYLTQDHLGSTRAVTGPDGAVVSRHDYLPFGEEILGRGGRTTALKYAADSMSGPAQKFTGKERDTESGLDYFQARYFSGAGGRFTSVDPENAGADPADPQSWNGYAYARNNPLLYIDPLGLQPIYSYDLLTEEEKRILIATAEVRGEEDGRAVYEGLSDAEANAYVNALRKLASVYSPAVSQIHSVEGFDRASVKLIVSASFTKSVKESVRFQVNGLTGIRSKGLSPFIGLEVTPDENITTVATLDIDLGNIAARGPARFLGLAIHGVEFAVNDIYGGAIEMFFDGKRPATPQGVVYRLRRLNQFVSRLFRRNK